MNENRTPESKQRLAIRQSHPSPAQGPGRSSVLVIGGGVAGASVAITLARRNVSVDLVEKSEFPRDKTCGCCIGSIGRDSLSKLGIDPDLIPGGSATNRWLGSLDGHHVELKLPKGLAISRRDLDPALVAMAKSLGVQINMQVSAKIDSVTEQSVGVLLRSDEGSRKAFYDVVVIAAGLAFGGIERFLPFIQAPHGPLGVSFMAASDSVDPSTIYMACDDDGYVGVVRLGDGRVDVAGAIQSGGDAARQGSPEQRVRRILDRSELELGPLEPTTAMMSTPALRRSRLCGRGRLIAIGDSAGYVEPFTGEGMTWAMQSGLAAGNLIADFSEQTDAFDWNALGAKWVIRQGQVLRRKKRACRLLTTALRNRAARRIAAETLSRLPGLAGPLVRRLNAR